LFGLFLLVSILGSELTYHHPPLSEIPQIVSAIQQFSTNNPYQILCRYLGSSSTLQSPPYHYHDTRAIIKLDDSAQFSPDMRRDLEWAMYVIILNHLERLKDAKARDWVDICILELCSWWKPDQTCQPTPIPSALVYYINNRKDPEALNDLLYSYHIPSVKVNMHLWSAFPTTLSGGSSLPDEYRYLNSRLIMGADEVLASLWCVAAHTQWPVLLEVATDAYEAALQAVINSSGSSYMTFSVIAMIKAKIIDQLGHFPAAAFRSLFTHWLLPTTTAIDLPSDVLDDAPAFFHHRISEAKIAQLAEFLEDFNSEVLPYKMAETICSIGVYIPCAQIHENHQIRLANGIHRVSTLDEPHGPELLNAIINTEIFMIYAGASESHPNFDREELPNMGGDDQTTEVQSNLQVYQSPPTIKPWLESPTARLKIKDALSGYVSKFPSSVNASPLVARVNSMLRGLDLLHTESS
jgi:hypothetical protein